MQEALNQKKVVVIGAGLGGMSAAISLAAAGLRVQVHEKNPHVGGKLNVLRQEGFSFDLGPSILTLPQFFRALFERAGRRFEDYVPIVNVSPHWRNFFEDGTVLDLHLDPAQMQAELRKLPGYAETLWAQFEKFLHYSREQYDILEEGYLRRGLDTLWEFLRHYGVFRIGRRIDFRRTMAEAIADHFEEPHLRAIFEYFIKYVGSSAYDAPGYMNLLPNIQFQHDLWYVPGGMYGLARGLERLARELGIEIHTDSEVTAILHEDRRVTGVRLQDGHVARADYVISNMEVIPAYEKLLGESPGFLRKLEKFEPTCSGLVVHLGTDRVYPQLAHHNFFYSKDQTKHFATVFREHRLPEDPTIYLVAVTRSDASQAPAGCDNIKVLPHIPHLSDQHPYTREDYLAFKERVLEKLERMGLTDLRKHAVVQDVWTPHDIQERYYSNKGSIYGVVSDWNRNYGFKAPKRSPRYRNLYFTGGSVNPGGGMPMVVLCGQKVADAIIESALPGATASAQNTGPVVVGAGAPAATPGSEASNATGAITIPEPLWSLLRRAVAERATDVHLDPTDAGKLVRFRVDGVIHTKEPVPFELRGKLLNQLKVCCNFDIAKTFAPLEGSLHFLDGGIPHEVRVTVVPIGSREAIHLRFTSVGRHRPGLGELGFDPEEIQTLRSVLAAPSGLVLVAGATGAGKSTTLYALAEMLDLKSRVAAAIEDPVEFRLPHVRQLQVDEFHKISMDAGLRVLLRMNPDIILVGEIRDEKSAIVAGRAALAGCQVMATIHARSAFSAADALHQLAVPRHVIGASLRLIIMQELIRRVCPHCAQAGPPTIEEQALFEKHRVPPAAELVRARGCPRCNGYGYYGRVGVFEVTPVGRELGYAIADGAHPVQRQRLFEQAAFQTMAANALQKAAQRQTTIEEAVQLCLGRELAP